jgi:type I restriction-modification system DNA methylase subunit
MKSPVFGAKAGNIKMRGKKTKLLSCLCCGMIDCRWEQRFKEAKKEIENEAKTNRART